MVVDNLPAVGILSEDQGEAAMRFVVRAFQFPTAERNCGIVAQRCGLKIRKGERAHLRAVGIFRFVAIEHFLPAPGDFVAGNENGLVGTPVTIHERVDVSAVPGVLLRAQNTLNFRRGSTFRLLGQDGSNGGDPKCNEQELLRHSREATKSYGVGVGEGVGVINGVAVGVDVATGVGVGVDE